MAVFCIDLFNRMYGGSVLFLLGIGKRIANTFKTSFRGAYSVRLSRLQPDLSEVLG
jgi:hypothetical protein